MSDRRSIYVPSRAGTAKVLEAGAAVLRQHGLRPKLNYTVTRTVLEYDDTLTTPAIDSQVDAAMDAAEKAVDAAALRRFRG